MVKLMPSGNLYCRVVCRVVPGWCLRVFCFWGGLIFFVVLSLQTQFNCCANKHALSSTIFNTQGLQLHTRPIRPTQKLLCQRHPGEFQPDFWPSTPSISYAQANGLFRALSDAVRKQFGHELQRSDMELLIQHCHVHFKRNLVRVARNGELFLLCGQFSLSRKH